MNRIPRRWLARVGAGLGCVFAYACSSSAVVGPATSSQGGAGNQAGAPQGGSGGTSTQTTSGGGSKPVDPCAPSSKEPKNCAQSCGATTYCDFYRDQCGNKTAGTCEPLPTSCPDEDAAVCACDGQVYASPCHAAIAGQDVSKLHNCTPPDGTFRCGEWFCQIDAEYCNHVAAEAGQDGHECVPIPAACASTPTCACLTTQVEGFCSECGSGSMWLTIAAL